MHASAQIFDEHVAENQSQSPCKARHFTAIEGIPSNYILEKLHQLGPRYFGDRSTAFAELYVEGIDKPFWVHEEYLVLQSVFFQEGFKNITSGDIITITIPSPDTFEPILQYLYDGDADKWYNTFTLENYYDVWQNIEFLGLGTEAQSICLAYYQSEVQKYLDDEMVEEEEEGVKFL